MAEDLRKSEGQAVIDRTPPLNIGSPARAEKMQGIRGPFGFGYLILGVLLGGAVAGGVLLINSSTGHRSANPSEFHATGVGPAALQQIARAVGVKYRLQNGDQLLGIAARPAAPPELVTTQGRAVLSAVVVHASPLEVRSDIRITDFTKGAYYVMCGTGKGCAIPGTPSVERGALVDREIVELSLLTLNTLASVDTVLVFRPPLGSTTPFVMLSRADLAGALSRPVSDTLAPLPRLTPSSLPSDEAAKVAKIVEGHVFALDPNNSFQALPDQTFAIEATALG